MRRRHGRSGRAKAAAAAAVAAGAAAAALAARPQRRCAAAWLLAGAGRGCGIARRGGVSRRSFFQSWPQQGFDPSGILPAIRELLGSPERALQKERDEFKKERDEYKAELRESLVREFEGNRRLLDAVAENKELHAAYQYACMSYEKVLDELEATEVLEDDLRGKIEELQWHEAKLESACWDAEEELEELRPLREEQERLTAELELSEGKKVHLKKQLADAELCKAELQKKNINLEGNLADVVAELEAAEERQQLLEGDMKGLLDLIDNYEAEATERRLAEAKEPPQAKQQPEAEIRDQLDKAWALPEKDLGRAGETAP